MYQDFTTYNEVDPDSKITITENVCTVSSLGNNSDTWVYKDFSSNYFNANFEHLLQFKMSSGTVIGNKNIWALTNTIDDFIACNDALGLNINYNNGSPYLYLREISSGTVYTVNHSFSLNTDYYLTISRDETIGIYGTLYCKVYSDSDRVTLLYTLSLTLHATIDFQYIFCLQRYTSVSQNGVISGYSSNLDLQINIPVENVEESDTLSISDDIELNISLEKLSLIDTIYLNEKISLGTETEEEIDSINILDNIQISDVLKKQESDTLSISDDIELNISLEKEIVLDSLSISDSILLAWVETNDLVNDFRFVKEELENINNNFSFCKQLLNNIGNICNTAYSAGVNIIHKINTLRQEKYNIKNDIRTLLSFQVPGDAGVQSLGKSYITIKINNILQEDIDIDSIIINKILDSAHTASFELGRAYDATKPLIESIVEIKYHIWTLFKGYITQIVPSDNPEHIKIQCQDEYWKKNQEKVYFNIGHIPVGDTELYYTTILQGLTVCGTSFNIGNFIPQTINLFGSPKSDAISNLVNESGNYSWYYNPNGSMKLWIAGSGDIINIERQEIGKNLGLYQVLSHSIKEDAESLVNKFRVQMGQQVIKRFSSNGASQKYSSYISEYFPFTPTPNWSSNLEILAKNSGTGYGWDFHLTKDDPLYEKVFKEYPLSSGGNLDAQFEGWSDEFTPSIEINNSGSIMGWECSVPAGRLKTGFTIDYENNLLIFTEPIFCFQKNVYGEVTAIQRPQVSVCLYKKKYYNKTSSSGDNPITDITNPLMFFTEVMGTYPITIMNNLNLTNLSIQIGGWMRENEHTWKLIPSWNDTIFAQDYANWQLSQNCDKKYSGTIEVTLDTFCYYGIELNKRIMINNILDSALNIDNITLNISSFTASISLKSCRQFARSISIQSRGE